jgi:hypothetical protein
MNWLHTFWFGYWWASIKGNAPEDVTSLLVVGTLSAFFVPVVRHWFETKWGHLHAKLDHLIVHTEGVPNVVPGLPPDKQPTLPQSQATPPPAEPGQ